MAPKLSGRGTGSDMYRNEGICVDVANAHAAEIIGQDYPYTAWAGHFLPVAAARALREDRRRGGAARHPA
jgi:hypothetical protein